MYKFWRSFSECMNYIDHDFYFVSYVIPSISPMTSDLIVQRFLVGVDVELAWIGSLLSKQGKSKSSIAWFGSLYSSLSLLILPC